MTFLRRHLSYANVMATIAVFVALGGASYAAFVLPPNSVGTRQIKRKAVTLSRISPKARKALRGARGPRGMTGAPATRLWATVDDTGNVVRSSGGVTVSNVSGGEADVTFPQDVSACTALASIGATAVGNNMQPGEVAPTNIGGHVVRVATFNSAGTFTQKPFHIAVFC